MGALADNQPAIFRSVWQKVDKALKAAEAWLQRVLILVGPGLVCLEIFAVGEAEVDCVKADDEVLGIVDLLKGAYDTGFLTDRPCPRLVRSA